MTKVYSNNSRRFRSWTADLCGETYEPFKELGAHLVTAFDPSIESISTKTLFQKASRRHYPPIIENVEVQTEAENEVGLCTSLVAANC